MDNIVDIVSIVDVEVVVFSDIGSLRSQKTEGLPPLCLPAN